MSQQVSTQLSGLTALLNAKDKKTAISDFTQSVQDQVAAQAQTSLQDNIMSKTNIGASFEKAFAVIRHYKTVTRSNISNWCRAFGAQLKTAIDQGKANLESYAPMLTQITQIWNDAFKPTTAADFFNMLKTNIENTRVSLQNAVSSSVNDQVFIKPILRQAVRNVGQL